MEVSAARSGYALLLPKGFHRVLQGSEASVPRGLQSIHEALALIDHIWKSTPFDPTFKAFYNQTQHAMNITFNELRRIKDNLPDGSIHRIAKELDLNVETVWNYFGGYSHRKGEPMGVHLEEGPDGGVVALDDTRILDLANTILSEVNVSA